MPDGPEVDMDDLMERITGVMPEGVGISDMKVEPIAFGLKKVVLSTVMDDAEGLVDKLEEAVLALDGVQNIECVTTTLL